MSGTKSSALRSRSVRRGGQGGSAAVEFALVVMIFFVIVFGIIEIARVMYMFNTLAEVTRRAARAATNIPFADQPALDLARKRAVLNGQSGALPFGQPITFENVRIEYLYLGPLGGGQELQIIPGGTMPSSPAQNRVNCMSDPHGTSCIRAVQARICAERTIAGPCTRVAYQPMMPLISVPFALPMSTTIVKAETLGFKAGDTPDS